MARQIEKLGILDQMLIDLGWTKAGAIRRTEFMTYVRSIARLRGRSCWAEIHHIDDAYQGGANEKAEKREQTCTHPKV